MPDDDASRGGEPTVDHADAAEGQRETMVLEARTVRDHLDDYALRASRQLGTHTEVSITLRHRGHDRLAATSSERAARCDVVEHDSASGPCVTAMDSLQVVLVPDLTEERRWPSWREATLREGFRAAAGVPAHVSEGAEIALNLYSERLDPWDSEMLLRADAYAQDIARTVRLCLELARHTAPTTPTEHVPDAYAALDQAVRLTMAAEGVDAARALELLLEAAAQRGAVPGSPAADAAPETSR